LSNQNFEPKLQQTLTSFQIQSFLNPSLCVDTYGRDEHSQLGLFHCADDLANPQTAQFFVLRHFRDIELKGTMFCFDQDDAGGLATAICHHAQGNQYFRYDLDSKQIYHGSLSRDECLDMDETKTDTNAVFIAKCDENSLSQKWNWGFVNETALTNWSKFGTDIIDKQEIEILSGGEKTNDE
jgi:Ricin-type beta-trefoil lectin domain